ncbi:MAG: UDP-N-acetylmuramate:L-alanyl-gamma-D-glutamyl-meso-diaminopimelate ligase [Pseudomonadota bacterium]
MHIHILGICGTFMAGIALLAKQMGYKVTGSDLNVYPPMSTQLEEAGIKLIEGYGATQLDSPPDEVVVGNVMTRGHDVIERMLDEQYTLISGPQWLYQHILKNRWVLAVSGTHGKTSTSSMLAHILDEAGLNPGFLIGGIPNDFDVSARIGSGPFFVIEADEYDTAFFDKRSKFMHYHPRTLIISNVEFDHADIFRDLKDIQRQFHHLVKLIPQEGKIIFNGDDENISNILQQGSWSNMESFGSSEQCYWHLNDFDKHKRPFKFSLKNDKQYDCILNQIGKYNAMNAISAIAAARHAGVTVDQSMQALENFKGVKRRLENKGEHGGVTVYDDFAHHPTEIQCTLEAFKEHNDKERMIVVFEPRSNTMRMGVHAGELKKALSLATELFVYGSEDLEWSLEQELEGLSCRIFSDINQIVEGLLQTLRPDDNVLLLSNGGFDGLCAKLIARLDHG